MIPYLGDQKPFISPRPYHLAMQVKLIGRHISEDQPLYDNALFNFTW